MTSRLASGRSTVSPNPVRSKAETSRASIFSAAPNRPCSPPSSVPASISLVSAAPTYCRSSANNLLPPRYPDNSPVCAISASIKRVLGTYRYYLERTTGHAISSLHTLGRPWPDSSTYTWKLVALPRKAIPVGMLRPEAKTEAVNPCGRLMDGGRLVLKNAVLFIQFGAVDGFDTVCASVTVGTA